MATNAKTPGSRTKLVLWSLLIVLFVSGVFFAAQYTMLKLRVAFADGQIAIFDQMKVSANGTTDPRKLSGQLEYVVNYYPSGSKQVKGTQLDRVVESARSNAIAAIISHLRTATGKDLGTDPQKWLNDYPPSH